MDLIMDKEGVHACNDEARCQDVKNGEKMPRQLGILSYIIFAVKCQYNI